jgi:hypothetical protein
MLALWRFHPGRWVSRLVIAARQVPPEEHDRDAATGCGVFWMVDGII